MVRRVSVIVDADTKPFTAQLAKAGAEALALKKLLDGLDDRVDIKVDVDGGQKLAAAQREVNQLTGRRRVIDVDTTRARAEVDQLSGRLRIGADLLALFGPAAAPITALAVPAVAGLTSQLALASAAGITTALAFQGVGDALGAIERARLEPTVSNLYAAEQALARLTPQAREFASELGAMRPAIAAATVDAAAEGLFPGLTRSLDDLEALLPRAERFFTEIGDVTGDLTADAAESLASPRWTEFFDYLQAEARPTLTDLYSTVGDLTHGLANLMMATDPLSDDFSSWLAGTASDFDAWSASLAQSDGFAEFVDYVRENGPQVAETARAIGGALVDIGVAAAPLGGPSLAALEAIAKVITTIADSPLGTPLLGLAAGLAALNRSMAIANRFTSAPVFAATKRQVTGLSTGVKNLAGDFGALAVAQGGAHRAGRGVRADMDAAATRAALARERISGYGAAAGKAALGVGALTVASTEMGETLGIQNTATLGLAGSMLSKWGGAAGAAVGAVLDLRAANQDLETGFQRMVQAGPNDQLVDLQANLRGLSEQGRLVDDFWSRMINPIEQIKALGSGEIIASTKAAWADVVGYGVSDMRADLEAYNRAAADAANTGDLGDVLAAPFDRAAGSIAGATAATVDFTAATSRLERFLSGQAALVDYESALDDVSEALARNGNNFDFNTRAGQDNGRAMIALGESAINYAKSLEGPERRSFLRDVRRDLRGLQDEFPAAGRIINNITRELDGLKPAKIQVDSSGVRLAESQARQLRRVYETFPEDLRTRIETTGVPSSKTEIKALQKAYDLTPDQVRTLMTLQAAGAKLGIRDIQALLGQTDRMRPNPRVTAQTAGAVAAIGAVIGQMNAIPPNQFRTITIETVRRTVLETVNAGRRAFGLPPSAQGNYFRNVQAYAGGGYDPRDRADHHQPELAGPGVIRVWREPETQGEAYIPLANDYRRPRAKNIIEQAVDQFGGDVEWFAEGGKRGGRERRRALRRAVRGFDPDPEDGRSGVRSDINEFRRALKDAGRDWTKQMRRQSDQMLKVTGRYARLGRRLEEYEQDLKDLRQADRAYRGEVAGKFRNELFGNGVAGLKLQLEADRNDARSFLSASRTAERLGLSGGLAKELYASGDLNTAQQIAGMSRTEIANLEKLYASRQTTTRDLGDFAGREIYARSIREQIATNRQTERTMARLDRRLGGLEKAVERGARAGSNSGTRDGMNDRNRRTTAMIKAVKR